MQTHLSEGELAGRSSATSITRCRTDIASSALSSMLVRMTAPRLSAGRNATRSEKPGMAPGCHVTCQIIAVSI